MMHTRFTPILLVVLLLTLSACEPFGINNSNNDRRKAPRDSVQQAYYEDAQQLVVRRMVAENNLAVQIPDRRVQPFYEALLAVYNARDLSARDSIVGIHAFPRYNLHEIVVGVEETAEWVEAWQSGERLTRYAPIDDLIERYELRLEQYIDFDGDGVAVLRSETPINPVGLSAKFEGIAGVRYGEQNGFAGGGGDIQVDVLDDAFQLRFSRAWGDCPAGCIYRKTWTFQVHGDETVTFEGTTTE